MNRFQADLRYSVLSELFHPFSIDRLFSRMLIKPEDSFKAILDSCPVTRQETCEAVPLTGRNNLLTKLALTGVKAN